MAEFDLSSILNNLSSQDMENLKNAASKLLGESPMSEPQNKSVPDFSSLVGNVLPDMNVLSKLAPVLVSLNQKDERTELIEAIKPLLSEKRRAKADEAERLLRLFSVLPVLKEQGIMG